MEITLKCCYSRHKQLSIHAEFPIVDQFEGDNGKKER